jgi:predicted DNA-binding transcriptional regulator AlpA
MGTTRPHALVSSTLVPLEDLVGLSEIATLLGVHKRTAQNYLGRDDFPEPLGQTSAGRVWRREDVRQWGHEHLPLPRPGRPRKRDS